MWFDRALAQYVRYLPGQSVYFDSLVVSQVCSTNVKILSFLKKRPAN